MFSVSVDFARRGQTPFRFRKPLPAVGKRHFVFVSPCPPRASPFSFQNTLARAGQAIYFFISPLPALGKLFLFSFCLCPPWASKLFLEKRREALLINNSIPSGLPHPSVILPNTANAHASDGVSGSLRLSR